MFLAINAFILLTTIAIFIISYYLCTLWNSTFPAEEKGVHVIKIIEAFMKILPLGPANEWILEPTVIATPRCWRHKLPFQLWGKIPYVYGCSTLLETSPLSVMHTIWETEDWEKWNPNAVHMQFSLKQMEDATLRNDSHMQCSQIISAVKGLQYFRFSPLNADNLSWVFFWHVKKIDFWFFHVQPIIKNDFDCCILSCIRGTTSAIKDPAKELSFTANAIKDAVELDYHHSNSNANISHSQRNIKCDYPQDNLIKSIGDRYSASSSDEGTKSDAIHDVFKLIPHFQRIKKNNVSGFSISIENVWNSESSNKIQRDDPKSTQNTKGRVSQRKSTLSTVKQKCQKANRTYIINSASDPPTQLSRKLSFFDESNSDKSSLFIKRTKTVSSVTENQKIEHVRQRWFSEASLNKPPTVPKLPDSLRLGEVSEKEEQEEEETHTEPKLLCDTDINETKVESIISSNSSDEFHSNKSDKVEDDFEMLLPNIELSDHRLADLLTKGNSCCAQLQAEMLKAANVNFSISNPDQHLGSWCYHSSYKGAILLSKVSHCGSLKIVSYLCEINIPLHPDEVWPTMKNPYLRFVYDETAKKVSILERISDDQKIIHTYHETGNLIKKEPIDFCLLHTERQEHLKYYVAFRSYEYANCPLMSNAVRGTIMPSGWVVELCRTKESKVSYLYQIIANKPNSSYIQDLSTLLPAAVFNLRTYVMTKPCIP